jgi:hypothetical protein
LLLPPEGKSKPTLSALKPLVHAIQIADNWQAEGHMDTLAVACIPQAKSCSLRSNARTLSNPVLEKCDTPKATIPASTGPVDISSIPVEHLVNGLRRRINQVNAAVALTLLATTYYRCRD